MPPLGTGMSYKALLYSLSVPLWDWQSRLEDFLLYAQGKTFPAFIIIQLYSHLSTETQLVTCNNEGDKGHLVIQQGSVSTNSFSYCHTAETMSWPHSFYQSDIFKASLPAHLIFFSYGYLESSLCSQAAFGHVPCGFHIISNWDGLHMMVCFWSNAINKQS